MGTFRGTRVSNSRTGASSPMNRPADDESAPTK